jgi:hypothetical protein
MPKSNQQREHMRMPLVLKAMTQPVLLSSKGGNASEQAAKLLVAINPSPVTISRDSSSAIMQTHIAICLFRFVLTATTSVVSGVRIHHVGFDLVVLLLRAKSC